LRNNCEQKDSGIYGDADETEIPGLRPPGEGKS
jgi:hypothetical protein